MRLGKFLIALVAAVVICNADGEERAAEIAVGIAILN